jgi:hypothetical protein
MGLMDSAKKLAKHKDKVLQNKDKIADGVGKATDFVDKKTGGKHSDKLKKVDDAAAKFAGKESGTSKESGTGKETGTSTSAAPGRDPAERPPTA